VETERETYSAVMRVHIGDGVRLFVDVDGFGLVPDDDGSRMRDRPTIVAMHGGPGLDHVGLKLGLESLRDVAQLVVYDHRGHGRSDRRSVDEWTLDTWADDVVRLCDVLGIERPIVLGNSFGGFVALRYLTRHPDHAAKVILYATMANGRLDGIVEGFRAVGGDEAAEAARAFWSAPSESTVARYQQLCRPLYTTRDEPITSDALTIRHDAVFAHFAASEMWTFDHRNDLAHVTCPVLVLSGEHDPVCSPASTRDMVEALPAASTTWVRFDGSSHAIARDEPDAFGAAVRSFIGDGA
jgi:pimeloyl-ACP methyl ester carboxylesterase